MPHIFTRIKSPKLRHFGKWQTDFINFEILIEIRKNFILSFFIPSYPLYFPLSLLVPRTISLRLIYIFCTTYHLMIMLFTCVAKSISFPLEIPYYFPVVKLLFTSNFSKLSRKPSLLTTAAIRRTLYIATYFCRFVKFARFLFSIFVLFQGNVSYSNPETHCGYESYF